MFDEQNSSRIFMMLPNIDFDIIEYFQIHERIQKFQIHGEIHRGANSIVLPNAPVPSISPLLQIISHQNPNTSCPFFAIFLLFIYAFAACYGSSPYPANTSTPLPSFLRRREANNSGRRMKPRGKSLFYGYISSTSPSEIIFLKLSSTESIKPISVLKTNGTSSVAAL